ncbi:FtsB family cell division protein [Desulfosediminicola flagellatus]|uniref:FtsB family cell division protein n=1 Tax=Desulfosediminicola flagellatus TaxID=2569541 RepID=UPI0010AD3ABB|nr:septum formation initiator family protein [Desulfosediminicola flagellatus]
MRRNQTQKLTPLQQKWILRAGIALVVLAVVWLCAAPRIGLISILKQRSELQELQAETDKIEKDKVTLEVEIDKLKNDSGYLEEVARGEFGMLKPHERVYDFSKPDEDEK